MGPPHFHGSSTFVLSQTGALSPGSSAVSASATTVVSTPGRRLAQPRNKIQAARVPEKTDGLMAGPFQTGPAHAQPTGHSSEWRLFTKILREALAASRYRRSTCHNFCHIWQHMFFSWKPRVGSLLREHQDLTRSRWMHSSGLRLSRHAILYASGCRPHMSSGTVLLTQARGVLAWKSATPSQPWPRLFAPGRVAQHPGSNSGVRCR